MTRRLRPFIAIDGEGIGQGSRHRYAYIAASTGDNLTSHAPYGFKGVEVMAFLLELALHNPDALFVGFGLRYDVSMMCRGMTQDQLTELWDSGEVDVEMPEMPGGVARFGYHHKRFTLAHNDVSMQVTDLRYFTQTSFLESLQIFGIDKSEPLVYKAIERGKNRRGTFGRNDMDKVRTYCDLEVGMIGTLAARIRESLKDADIPVLGWYGSGAIAAALLRDKQVKLQRPHLHSIPEETLLRAYHFGRVETFRQGQFALATRYDLRSAYAAALSELPSALGKWRRVTDYDVGHRWAIWRVDWQVPEGTLVTPFPYRHDGRLSYPREGQGWYHASEVKAAVHRFGSGIEVSSGYVFEPQDPQARPFGWLREMYERRLELAAQGDPAAHLLKLALATVWGKTAQRDDRRPPYRRAPFRDWFWSGAATAEVRARMLWLATVLGEDRLISFATDGVMVRGTDTLHYEEQAKHYPNGKGLGTWATSQLRDVVLIDAVTYGTAEEVVTAGFSEQELTYELLLSAWQDHRQWAEVETTGTRFVGLGTAIMQGTPARLGTWQRWPLSLQFHDPGKFYDYSEDGHTRTLYPPPSATGGVSAPHDVFSYTSTDEPDSEDWMSDAEMARRVALDQDA